MRSLTGMLSETFLGRFKLMKFYNATSLWEGLSQGSFSLVDLLSVLERGLLQATTTFWSAWAAILLSSNLIRIRQNYSNLQPLGNKIMRLRSAVNESSFTGEPVQPVNYAAMKKRINAIKFRSSSKSFSIKQSRPEIELDLDKKPQRKIPDPETDSVSTNFWPARHQISSTIPAKSTTNEISLMKRSQDSKISRPQSHSIRTRSRVKPLRKQSRTADEKTYLKQIEYFAKLYQLLADVLASIKNSTEDMQSTVSAYGQFIRDPYLAFIDNFVEDRSEKIKKTVRVTRIHEYLSISYLFLQIAQERIDNNESYLVNFTGYCLSNLLFVARVYILLERNQDYQTHAFQKAVEDFEASSYGHVLVSMEDVLLRIQHNNEIITMIHRKLGVYNQKFEVCIKAFLKNADRKKYTTCLCAHYIFQYLAMHIHESQLVGISPFLEVAPTPYLAPRKHQYTLVFEPLGILKQGSSLRPYINQFMEWANKHFDVVMWTWQMPAQVDDFVQMFEPYLFSKLYRYHCIIKDQIYTKDLTRLGRDLKTTIIIDFDERIFGQTPKNGFVARWKGKPKDKGLLLICSVLEEMIGSESEVSDMLTFYAEELHGIRG